MIVGPYPFCDFKSIQKAINYIEKYYSESTERITLYILEGVYIGQVVIKQSRIRLVGIGQVTLSHNAYARQIDEKGNEIGTFRTATLYLDGKNVHVENITVENTAGQGEDIGQAIALYVNCDEAVFKDCHIRGHQDTLFLSPLPVKQKDGSNFLVNRSHHSKYHQYFDRCSIEGTVDFIFGGATAYFNQCLIKSKARENINQVGYITAACTPKNQAYGFIFNECYIVSESLDKSVYLGRPWRPYAKVRFQRCQMDGSIHEEGWHDWNNQENRQTVAFEEVQNTYLSLVKRDKNNWTLFSDEETVVSPHMVFLKEFYNKL